MTIFLGLPILLKYLLVSANALVGCRVRWLALAIMKFESSVSHLYSLLVLRLVVILCFFDSLLCIRSSTIVTLSTAFLISCFLLPKISFYLFLELILRLIKQIWVAWAWRWHAKVLDKIVACQFTKRKLSHVTLPFHKTHWCSSSWILQLRLN